MLLNSLIKPFIKYVIDLIIAIQRLSEELINRNTVNTKRRVNSSVGRYIEYVYSWLKRSIWTPYLWHTHKQKQCYVSISKERRLHTAQIKVLANAGAGSYSVHLTPAEHPTE